jgi:hypothetical protein
LANIIGYESEHLPRKQESFRRDCLMMGALSIEPKAEVHIYAEIVTSKFVLILIHDCWY